MCTDISTQGWGDGGTTLHQRERAGKGSGCRVQQRKGQTRDVINQGQGIKVQNIMLATSVMVIEQMCCM